MLTFALFEQRVIRPAGYLVVVFASLPIVESIVRIVLTAVYLASGRFAVQTHAEPPPPAPNPTLDAAEQATQPPAEQPDQSDTD